MREPTRRPSAGTPGWNEQAAVALLVVVAGHLCAVEPGPLTPDLLASLTGATGVEALRHAGDASQRLDGRQAQEATHD